MTTETITPPEFSGDGRQNAYTHFCVSIGQQVHYAVCLYRMSRLNEGGIAPNESACARNINTTVCPAFAKREEELAKGRAIYFVERAAAQLPPSAPVVVHPAPEPEPAISDDYMAEALTEAVAAERKTAAPALTVRPGETLLEAAKRIAAERNAA